jgi:hypothetical protein
MHTHQPHQSHHAVPTGPPVLDIGGDIGAVVVYLASIPEGGELEACPVDDRRRRFHTGVHLRRTGDRDTPVAVYPEVRAGDYDILDGDLRPVARVRVTGGAVTELRLD